MKFIISLNFYLSKRIYKNYTINTISRNRNLNYRFLIVGCCSDYTLIYTSIYRALFLQNMTGTLLI